VYGLATAQQFIASGACDTILLVGVEIISRFIDYTDRSTCVLFGDGAGAVVLQVSEQPPRVLSFVLGSDGSGAEHLILPGGGTNAPPTHETIEAGLPEGKVFINIDRYGNTSAASIPIALTEAIEQGRARPGDTLAFVAFGAGLTWAASMVKLGPRVQPTRVDRAWLKRLAWNPLGAVGAGLGRALSAISGSVARLVGWVRRS
jgi:3-oxoacyl-[acyl-carrier-protein] synthase-3